jgi:hypothetical protein
MPQSAQSQLFNKFAALADGRTGRFLDRTKAMPEWIDSSILFSDGFCFCVLCELLAVQHIVEAGTGFGGSTEMFARYFTEPEPVSRIWSVDDAVNPWLQWPLAKLGIRHYSRFVWSTEKGARQVAKERLRPFANVTLVRGDAHVHIPRIVARLASQGESVGVLLDGPKGLEQMLLAERLLREFHQVRFVAVDDIGPIFDIEGRGERFRASPYAAFATSDTAFFERYGWINQARVPARMSGQPTHTGYGMGILINAVVPCSLLPAPC